MRKRYFPWGVGLGILILSLMFRFYRLGSLPNAIFTDEMALGYNAWSLLTTAWDEYGSFLPLTLRSFDDYKPAVYAYLSTAWVGALGLNEFSTRATAALFGSFLPVGLYLLLKRLGFQTVSAGAAALVLVVAPGHWEISRTAIEAGVALSLATFALWLGASRKPQHILTGSGLGLLTLFTYHSARLVVPLLFVGLSLLLLKRKTRLGVRKLRTWSAIGLLLVGVSLAIFSSQSRFSQISILTDQTGTLLREEAYREDGSWPEGSVSIVATRIYHNKLISTTLLGAESFMRHSSPQFLFLGGAQPPRATIPGVGQFLLILFPFFLLGVGKSVHQWQRRDRFIALWWLVALIPPSLTLAETPNVYRSVFLFVPIATYCGLGLTLASDTLRRLLSRYSVRVQTLGWGLAAGLLGLGLLGNTAYAWHQYSFHQQIHQPWHRQYGYRELFTYLDTLDADRIFITNRENEPYMAYLFFQPVSPQVYQQQPTKRLGHQEISNGQQTWDLFQFTFTEAACPHDLTDTNPRHYYVSQFTCELPPGFVREKTVSFFDGNPEFFVDRPK